MDQREFECQCQYLVWTPKSLNPPLTNTEYHQVVSTTTKAWSHQKVAQQKYLLNILL